jgi:transposase-like protein
VSATKFTAETRATIVGHVAAGASLADAARRAGVREKTLTGWLARGRRDDLGPFAVFAADVADARKRAQQPPGPMTPAEFREHLERAVRAGSVQAMRLWADQYLLPPEAAPDVPTSAIARLVHRHNEPQDAA